MGFEKIRSIRPLTKLMLKLLQDCYHTEKHDLEPPALYDGELIKGLMERGLMERQHPDKNTRPYIITDLGREYLKHYFGD